MHKNTPSTRVPLIKLSMLDKDIIERVSPILQSNVNESKTPKGDKTMYTVASAKRSVVEPLLFSIFPYMGIRRKEQITKMLNHYKLKDEAHE